MKTLFLIISLCLVSLTSCAQSPENVKILDGKTANEIVGKFVVAVNEVIDYKGRPDSNEYTARIEGSNLGPVLSVLKYQGEIYLMIGKGNPVHFLKANDENLDLSGPAPEVEF